MHEADEAGNVVLGRHLGVASGNSIVHSTGDHLVVTVGLDDIIVVHTEDATLIASKQQEEAVRQIVERLAEKGWDQYL
jgi:mannose-1-phosphate guanylyltransferase